jgi:hypothetical protein
MQIVQLFHREKVEYDKFTSINEKHKKAWLKTVWYNSIFFPVAEISSSITLGLLVWYGGLNVAGGGTISLGTIFLFIQMSQMLFRPLRHIADKFNTLQMGMVAADRIFKILETESKMTDEGQWSPEHIEGKISIKNLEFSYLPDEKVIHGINLEILPVSGWGQLPGDKILPSVTLGFAYAAYIARLSRGGMLEVLNQDFIRTARAKGLTERNVVIKHAMQGGLIPVVSFLGPAIAGLLAGSFVVETIFQIPGLGRFYVEAAFNRDYTMILGTTIFFSAMIVFFNLLSDLAAMWLNPRSRDA